MSLKQDLETYVKAIEAYDAQDFEVALDQFEVRSSFYDIMGKSTNQTVDDNRHEQQDLL